MRLLECQQRFRLPCILAPVLTVQLYNLHADLVLLCNIVGRKSVKPPMRSVLKALVIASERGASQSNSIVLEVFSNPNIHPMLQWYELYSPALRLTVIP